MVDLKPTPDRPLLDEVGLTIIDVASEALRVMDSRLSGLLDNEKRIHQAAERARRTALKAAKERAAKRRRSLMLSAEGKPLQKDGTPMVGYTAEDEAFRQAQLKEQLAEVSRKQAEEGRDAERDSKDQIQSRLSENAEAVDGIRTATMNVLIDQQRELIDVSPVYAFRLRFDEPSEFDNQLAAVHDEDVKRRAPISGLHPADRAARVQSRFIENLTDLTGRDLNEFANPGELLANPQVAKLIEQSQIDLLAVSTGIPLVLSDQRLIPAAITEMASAVAMSVLTSPNRERTLGIAADFLSRAPEASMTPAAPDLTPGMQPAPTPTRGVVLH